ncbi:prolipoprotein diacylglyceryl transferase [Sneathia sanguinegens]|uniref:Phosphatidylglycerol--prolipoprotein diacylglyceryl transferase n=1 Tax=Sneathia sanguinegens TaxID=40543 RepID=A0ABT7HIU6_9FUSO|nr:prolipoprotein diacylglyceryl transferase [Sneathia sanguinegens]MDK9580431.1 prolipoprotein diacylglyceryl transferase [Sneathia sanguinegens]
MRPYLFKIGNFELRVYSLMYILALFIAIFLAKHDKLAKKRGITDNKQIEDFAFITLFSGLIGARIYYVILKWDYYSKMLNEIPMVWKGGLAIHGGIIGGIVAILIFSKMHNKKFFVLTDMSVGPLILGQALGRIGNFANGEIHGVPTFTPWSVIISGKFSTWWNLYNSLPLSEQAKYRPLVPWGVVFPENTSAGMEFPTYPLHPAMLYELVLNAIAFLLIWFVFRKKEYKRGILSMIYLILYGIIRIFVSAFRAEDLLIYGFKMPYIVSAIMIICGIVGIVIINKRTE